MMQELIDYIFIHAGHNPEIKQFIHEDESFNDYMCIIGYVDKNKMCRIDDDNLLYRMYFEVDGEISETAEHIHLTEEDYEEIQSKMSHCDICYSDDKNCFLGCSNCYNTICYNCYENVDKCPFCRKSRNYMLYRLFNLGNGVAFEIHKETRLTICGLPVHIYYTHEVLIELDDLFRLYHENMEDYDYARLLSHN